MVVAPRRGRAAGKSSGHLVESAANPGPGRPIKSAEPTDRVGMVVRRLREERGISLRDLGTRAHISSMQLWRVEQLESSSTEEKIRGLAKALGVPVGVLFGEPDRAPLRARIDRTLTCLAEIEGELRGLRQSIEFPEHETPSGPAAGSGHVALAVEARNRVGILRDIAEVFAKEKVNITDCVAVDGQGARAYLSVGVEMASPDQVQRIVQQISQIGEVEVVKVSNEVSKDIFVAEGIGRRMITGKMNKIVGMVKRPHRSRRRWATSPVPRHTP